MQSQVPVSGFWSERKVLVTGCSGFLGSWLTERLLDAGAEVVGIVRDHVPRSQFLGRGLADRVTLVRGGIEDYSLLERAVNEYEVETVFHLAAQPIVGTANRNPLGTFEANIRGTWNLLEACRRNTGCVRRVIVASSDKAYGNPTTLPYTEDMPLQGEYPYDVSKSCSDLLARCYHRTYKLPVGITRCGNFYGPGDLNFNRIVPGTIRSVLMNQPPVIRSDGTFIRDYIYVRDVVEGYLLLAERMDDPALHGEAFNFSDERQLSVLELTETILRLMERPDLRPQVLNEAKGEIKHQYLSARMARERLHWRPRYTVEEALRETIDWYRDFFQNRVTEHAATTGS